MSTIAFVPRARSWWHTKSGRERTIAMLLGALALVALAWLAVLEPLRADTARLERELAQARERLALGQTRASDIAALARSAPAVATGDARAQFDAAAIRLGVKPVAVERAAQDGLRVTFDAIAFDTLTRLVDELQREAKLRGTELDATALVEPGRVRAEITLRR